MTKAIRVRLILILGMLFILWGVAWLAISQHPEFGLSQVALGLVFSMVGAAMLRRGHTTRPPP